MIFVVYDDGFWVYVEKLFNESGFVFLINKLILVVDDWIVIEKIYFDCDGYWLFFVICGC